LEKPVTEIDDELLDACRRREKVALIRIYEKYAKAMFNTCVRIVHNDADAEDVMQESFIEGFDKIESFRGEGSLGAWLKRIAINNSINFIRRHRNIMSLDEKELELPDDAPLEQEISENIFCRLEEIKDALEKLDKNYRIILSLHLLEGYDHNEIAEILQISYGNVRTRYSRAKQKLLHIIMSARN
jgi:RNA polymerase sigma factor (sigma-70 family)